MKLLFTVLKFSVKSKQIDEIFLQESIEKLAIMEHNDKKFLEDIRIKMEAKTIKMLNVQKKILFL